MIAASGSLANWPRQLDGRHLAGVQPAVGGREAVAGVDAQRQFAGILPAGVAKPLRVDERGSADDEPRQAEIEQLPNRLLVADAAAKLALDVDRCQDFLDARQIDRQPLARPLQIDNMQVASAGVGKSPRHGRWIIGKDGLLLVVALPQPDAFSTAKIDRRPDLHGDCSVKGRGRRAGLVEKFWSVKYATAAGRRQGPAASPLACKLFCEKSFRAE